MIYSYNGHTPTIANDAFVAHNATITGDVTIGHQSSIWFNAVIRGDVSPTRIGNRVNIQDFSCLQQSPAYPLLLEDDVTIGHRVTLHSCHIKKGALIGMDSTILDGAVIGEGAFIGAGSLVPQGKVIPPNTLAFGSPVKIIRPLTDDDRQDMVRILNDYVQKGARYAKEQDRLLTSDASHNPSTK